jgi:endothelin-converting enzyme/putative endopeptidase
MKIKNIFVLLCLCAAAIVACSHTNAPASRSAEPSLPYTPSLDVASMDRSVNPCEDFYTYSCGRWMKNNPIPADQTSWSVYGKLYEDNLNYLHGILEEASTAKNRDTVTQEIGDYYAACMNETAIEKLGANPIQPELSAIVALTNIKDLAPLAATLHLEGDALLFDAGSTQDPDNSDAVIVGLNQGGLGLPDRDYYIKDDAKSKETRDKYLQHVRKMFELIGDSADVAKRNAETVMRIETSLAKASLARVEMRDPYKLKHKMSVADLNKVAPNFDWNTYFAASNVPTFEILNVSWPEFFKDVNSQLTSNSLDDLKTYLRFHVANCRS